VALLPVVAAPVGAVPGIRHVVWQDAACELHDIMQLVTIEVCATRIFPAASAVEYPSAIVNPAAKSKRGIPPELMAHFLSPGIITPSDERGNVPARSLPPTG
jgi:hypothetical protein